MLQLDEEQRSEFLDLVQEGHLPIGNKEALSIVKGLDLTPVTQQALLGLAYRWTEGRQEIAEHLSQSTPNAEFLDFLQTIADEGTPPEPARVADYLSRYADFPEAWALLDQLREDQDDEVRARALAIQHSQRFLQHGRPDTAGEPPSTNVEIEPWEASEDYQGILSDTTAAILRGSPRALVRQTEDVQARMKQLGDAHEDAGVRYAALTAEAALRAVLALINEDIDLEKARPTLRSLVSLTMDVAEIPLTILAPHAAAAFKATRMIVIYARDSTK